MRIGVLGGTFDPPHAGHLALARAAMEALELDEVIFVPAMQNPLKRQGGTALPRHRLAMVQRLISGEPNMSVSDVEITRGGKSYAVDTIQELQLARPGDYWFLLGSDALAEIQNWKQPERLLKLCRLAVVGRQGTDLDLTIRDVPREWRDKIDSVEMKAVRASSTEIRETLEENRAPGAWLTPEVRDYIEEHDLYKENR